MVRFVGYSRVLLMCFFALGSHSVFALGECGLSCCIAGATTSGVSLAKSFGLAVQYETMDMETIRNGSEEVSPDDVINQVWSMGSAYAVPTQMTMEKLSLIASVPINERWQLMGIVPFVRNNMDMRIKSPMGMVMDMSMKEISGLGDITILGFYTAYTDAPVRSTRRLRIGIGVKTPTGENEEVTPSNNYVHAMMQPGSGSWDGLLLINYMRAFYPLVTQVNGFYHLTTEGNTGYEFGNQVGLDLITRYQVAPYINLGLELNAIHASRDEDHDGNYSRPLVSMLDNTANTGLTSVFLSPVIQMKIPSSGSSAELKYQYPIRQRVNGYQQVIDSRIMATIAWVW